MSSDLGHIPSPLPNLNGPTISLVPLSLGHVGDFLRYSSDPTLWTWWLREPPLDERTMRNEVRVALEQRASRERIPFSLFHRERNEHIGSTSYWHIDRQNHALEIGSTWLATPFHGSGINREAKHLLLSHAFLEWKMTSVVLQTDELNQRSRRAIEKLGAKLERVIKDHRVTWSGRMRATAMYRISRDAWRASQRTPSA
ncbi:MAG: GNAT family protein [Opitutus sp.]